MRNYNEQILEAGRKKKRREQGAETAEVPFFWGK